MEPKFNPYQSEILTAWDLALLAKAMRDAQKDYFFHKMGESLKRARILERRVDKVLVEHKSTSTQYLALAVQVCAVRVAQKDYFSERTQRALLLAKENEVIFDKHLVVILDGLIDQVKQMGLWNHDHS